MKFIVYDLEMTVTRKKIQVSEIIEIGAVQIELVDGKPAVTGTFQSFVKPDRSPVISASTRALTGITQSELQSAETWPLVQERLLEWIGGGEYYLCAWGPDDLIQLGSDCRMHGTKTDWIRNHNNLQKLMAGLVQQDKQQQIGLKTALEYWNIPFDGSHHRALDDAINTAKLFVHLYDQLTLETNEMSDLPLYSTEVVYKTGTFTNSPFEKLALFAEKEPTA
ncbi:MULTISPECIES: 3'-5' exonuclease [Paenibacillus]|uniref:Exonuclease n=1 Tax=Paenibacillus lutrae TaxID=2078573 RepID=A0A7X3FLH9_9BACL|nr:MULTISPECIES: 3'-5' exonuclease [Paenibacillus]MVP01918.1 exonuclease [Paenibacillus lutrae]